MARPERAEPADLRKGRRGLLDPSIPLDARPALDEDLSGPHHLTDDGSRDDQPRSWLTLAASWAGPRPAAPARRACIELVKAGQTPPDRLAGGGELGFSAGQCRIPMPC